MKQENINTTILTGLTALSESYIQELMEEFKCDEHAIINSLIQSFYIQNKVEQRNPLSVYESGFNEGIKFLMTDIKNNIKRLK